MTRMEQKKAVITPGGRIGNDRSLGSRTNDENWVERHGKGGSLPRYVRIVRNGIMKNGVSESRATALAVASIKRWARGGDSVSPKVQAAAAKALAEWELMKAKARTKSFTEEALETKDVASVEELSQEQMDTILALVESDDTDNEEKGSAVSMEYKSVGVSGLNVVDEEKGIVETIVSVTGIVDNVKDIIETGAYEKSLNTRTPKGIWSHAWDTPVARTLDVKELAPGSDELPDKLPNGNPWPSEAGALKVKAQFNLETQRGRDAYSDVVFFGDTQEWSIGYQVPVGGATVDSKTGQRRIHTLELYEYSPVLFGAMPAARTQKIGQQKHELMESQLAYKSVVMPEVEFKSWMEGIFGEDEIPAEYKGSPKKSDDDDDEDEDDELFLVENEDEEDSDEDDDGEYDDEDDEEEEEPANRRRTGKKDAGIDLSGYEHEVLVKTYAAICELLGYDTKEEDIEYLEEKTADGSDEDDSEAGEASTLSDVVQEYGELVDEDFTDFASDFDAAVADDDYAAAEEAGNSILDMIEEADDPDDETREAYQAIARAIAELAPDAPDDEAEDEEPPVDEDDTEQKDEEKSDDVIVLETKELDALRMSVVAPRRI